MSESICSRCNGIRIPPGSRYIGGGKVCGCPELQPAAEDYAPLNDMRRAHMLFQLIEVWRKKGFDPQLYGSLQGWVLVLDTTKHGLMEVSERGKERNLRFNSNICETPEAAIENALEMIQP